jgi:hypothetical protein
VAVAVADLGGQGSESITWFLADLGPRVDSDRHSEPADAVDRTAVHLVLWSDQATALLPKDPCRRSAIGTTGTADLTVCKTSSGNP